MKFERSAGILLHPTSLPGKYGIGDLGPEAYRFVDFLESAGQKLWQVFPLGPTGYGDSPYQCFSAFAGNPLLTSPDKLVEEKLLNIDHHKYAQNKKPNEVDFESVINFKTALLKKAFYNFQNDSHIYKSSFENFCEENKIWLDDFAFFMALKDFHNGEQWTHWDNALVLRDKYALESWGEKLKDEINYHKFVQFIFFKQWGELKEYVNSKGIMIVGDIPIFVAYDSSDVWGNKELFSVDPKGKLLTVAGVPPDYFSATGQRWGNPLFNWEQMIKNNFQWWRDRISTLLKLVDIVRIDHFRGFDKYWEIPAEALTAEKGKWMKAPGEELFNTLKKYLGELPIIAEDLGIITKSVTMLREKFEFPGMKIMQFAFGTGMEKRFLPHNFIHNCVVYTGSHDNDTTKGFFQKEKEKNSDVYKHAQKYLNYYGEDIVGELIRTAYSSIADIVIIPMQDILRLGSEARMNFPGTLGGNWAWRFTWEQVPFGTADIYKEMTRLYERPPIPEKEPEEIDNP
jgi:4-alpha-glucanotransferase